MGAQFVALARAQLYEQADPSVPVLQAASRATKGLDQPQPLVMNMRGAPFGDCENSSGHPDGFHFLNAE